MHLLVLGVSHRTAPIALRERLDFASRGLSHAVAAVASQAATPEAVVLSTCNRAEVYVATEDVAAARRDLRQFFSEFHRVPAAELDGHYYDAVDADAARHLFRVASGLESMVIGEPQILGQVKSAYTLASEQRAAGPLLNRLFHLSFAVGKRVRADTGLGEGAVSVSYAAVSLARKIFGRLNGHRVLVVGTGDMGKLTARHLRSQGIADVAVTSRSTAHVDATAALLGARPIPWDGLRATLAEVDIVVTATGSVVPILDRQDISTAMRVRRHRPLFIIDIALPRDVDPEAGDIEQVFLYNVDDLQAIVHENMSRRSSEVQRAEHLVEEEVARFTAWLQSRDAIPTVVALRQRFEAIRRSELQRLDGKLSSLPPDARARVEEITRLVVEKLLLTPTERLKAVGDPEKVMTYSDTLNRLFNLGSDDAGPRAERSDAGAVDANPECHTTEERAPASKTRVRL